MTDKDSSEVEMVFITGIDQVLNGSLFNPGEDSRMPDKDAVLPEPGNVVLVGIVFAKCEVGGLVGFLKAFPV